MFGPKPDRIKTRKFMAAVHKGQKRATLRPQSVHPPIVAGLAEHWARRHFTKFRMIAPDDAAMVENIWHAGMLHGAIVRGRVTWDDILSATNLEVANIVAGVSYDNRLTRPRRVSEHKNHLYHADYPTQIVKLADIGCALLELMDFLRTGVENYDTEWLENCNEYIHAMEHLTRAKLSDEWAWCQKTVHQIAEAGKRLDLRQKILKDTNDCPWIKKPRAH